jgi:S-adenosylmethionine hydrolase
MSPTDSVTIQWMDKGDKNRQELHWIRPFGERPSGTLVASVGSLDRMEVGVVDGNARKLFKNELLAVQILLTTTAVDVDTISP